MCKTKIYRSWKDLSLKRLKPTEISFPKKNQKNQPSNFSFATSPFHKWWPLAFHPTNLQVLEVVLLKAFPNGSGSAPPWACKQLDWWKSRFHNFICNYYLYSLSLLLGFTLSCSLSMVSFIYIVIVEYVRPSTSFDFSCFFFLSLSLCQVLSLAARSVFVFRCVSASPSGPSVRLSVTVLVDI